MALVIAAISEGRSVRSELNVPPSARPPLLVTEAGPRERRILEANAAAIGQMLRVDGLRFDGARRRRRRALPRRGREPSPCRSPSSSTSPPSARGWPRSSRRSRSDIERTARKLANPDFVARAPEEVVDENRERLADAEAARDRLAAALTRLEAVG